MSEVSLFSAQLPAQHIAKSLRAFAASKTGLRKPLLRFTKQGTWQYGPEQIELDDKDELAVNPSSFMVGMIGWRGGQVVGEHMYPLQSPERVDVTTLEPIQKTNDGDGWNEQIAFDVKHMTDGTEMTFKSTSRGGMNASAALVDAIAAQIEADPTLPVAVITLGQDSYMHSNKAFGKIFVPVFNVIAWADSMGKVPSKPKGQRKLV